MAVEAKYSAYNRKGARCGGGSLQLPEYLDWMDIEVKAEYFRFIGQGEENSEFILLQSQGQEVLIVGVRLETLKHSEFKEKDDVAEAHINQFITEGGYSREPRNQ